MEHKAKMCVCVRPLRYRRRDHVFMLAHEFWGVRNVWHRHGVGKAIIRAVESHPLSMLGNDAVHGSSEHLDFPGFGTSETASSNVSAAAGILDGREEHATSVIPPHFHCLDFF